MKDKKTIITLSVVSAIILLLLLVATILFVKIRSDNQQTLNDDPHVVIYQYHVVDYKYDTSIPPVKIYDEVFTEDLFYEARIVAIDNPDRFSVIQIKDGVVRVIDTNCYHETCKHSDINIKGGLFNNTSIQCLPNGLEIKLEVD